MEENKQRLTADLLASVSGVLIFISLAHFIDLNGFSGISPVLIILGVTMLFFPSWYLHFLKPIHFISRPLLLTVSHILIFIGLKTYLSQFISDFWIYFLLAGIVFLNYNKEIAAKMFK